MAVSADSKQVVFRDRKGRAWAASLPDLAMVRPLISAQGDELSRGIAFSPDGRLLAFASRYDAIHLFNAETLEPIQSASGHTRHVASVHFLSDGKTLRSVGNDNVVCSWNTSTAKLEKQLQLPPHTVCVSVRPSDGRYALCASAADVDVPFWESKKEIPPAKVLDLNDGKVVSEVALPVNWPFNTTKVLWIKEPEALCLADFKLRRFNYLTGTVRDYGRNRIHGDVSEDGRSIYQIDGGGKDGTVKVERFAIETGELTPLGGADLPHMTGNFHGLVPGGKRFYVANPGVYLFDRTPVKLISEKRFKGWHMLRLCFSPDGSYYALAAAPQKRGSSAEESNEFAETVVRVHQTLSGDTLLAFAARDRMVKDLKFSPDGKQLAIVTNDGFIELRDVSLAQSR
jgi:WD40 repeat protein